MLLSDDEDVLVSGVRPNGWSGREVGLWRLDRGDCKGDARIGLPTGREAMCTGDDVLEPPDFILSILLTAIVGFTRLVILFALSIMSLD